MLIPVTIYKGPLTLLAHLKIQKSKNLRKIKLSIVLFTIATIFLNRKCNDFHKKLLRESVEVSVEVWHNV